LAVRGGPAVTARFRTIQVCPKHLMALGDRLRVRENEPQRPCGYFWEGVNRMFGMRRREFITLLGGAAAWPLAARAQQPMPVVGFLNGASPLQFSYLTAAFRQGLSEAGFQDGRNVAIEYRWAEGHNDRIPPLASDLIERRVAVIAATGGVGESPLVTKIATPTTPVVFLAAGDPVKLGHVASFNRPGGNITGVSFFLNALGAKRLELLRETVPAVTRIAVLVDPSYPDFEPFLNDVLAAGITLGRQISVLNATTEHEVDVAFREFVGGAIGALVVSPSPILLARREQIVGLAARYAVPAIYQLREFPAVGGLMSYGTSISDAYRQVGIYVGRILKGAKPADLPIIQPTKFELPINLKTAKALGIDLPSKLLALADEVIE
jgi:putative tryptophan/tyrosine transport system substrate-binding protein